MIDSRTLEELREVVNRETPYIDIKPYSHNIIGLALSVIAAKYGEEEAVKAIKDFGLDKKGWNVD
jgi:hypothetical protein